jgi:hypothetical protein
MISRLVCAVAGLLVSQAVIADFKPDTSALIRDLSVTRQSQDRMTVVFWLPPQFWRASLESGGMTDPKQVDRFVQNIEPYVILAVADGRRALASVTFSEPDLLRNTVTIETVHGDRLSALPDEGISDGVRTLTQMMRPVLGNMLGSLGVHVVFVVFPATDKKGQPTVDPTKDGTFVVHIGEVEVRYALPLGSLLPPAIDPKTGESFPGNYHFNPFTGTKLSAKPAGSEKQPAPSQSSPSAPPDTSSKP